MSEETNIEDESALMKEFIDLANEIDGHSFRCTCPSCERFMELGEKIHIARKTKQSE